MRYHPSWPIHLPIYSSTIVIVLIVWEPVFVTMEYILPTSQQRTTTTADHIGARCLIGACLVTSEYISSFFPMFSDYATTTTSTPSTIYKRLQVEDGYINYVPRVPTATSTAINPFRTAVPFWVQISQILSNMCPERDCGSKRVNDYIFLTRDS